MEKRPSNGIIPGEAHRRILPPEAIAAMERDFVESFREMMEMRGLLQPPFTEEEQRELNRVASSCDCKFDGKSHAHDCAIWRGLSAFAKRRKEQLERGL